VKDELKSTKVVVTLERARGGYCRDDSAAQAAAGNPARHRGGTPPLHNSSEIFSKKYLRLRPPEMEKVTLALGALGLASGDTVAFALEAV
jgi:hypothetical protein